MIVFKAFASGFNYETNESSLPIWKEGVYYAKIQSKVILVTTRVGCSSSDALRSEIKVWLYRFFVPKRPNV